MKSDHLISWTQNHDSKKNEYLNQPIFIVFFCFQNPENKQMLSEIYLEHYKTIMYDFMSDDQELDVSIGKTKF